MVRLLLRLVDQDKKPSGDDINLKVSFLIKFDVCISECTLVFAEMNFPFKKHNNRWQYLHVDPNVSPN